MVNCYLTLNAQVFYPELPIGRETLLIAEDRRMLNGQLRRAYRAGKRRLTFTLRDATEAERSAWLTAATYAASVTFVDEGGGSYAVMVTEVRDDLTRTVPAVEGGAATTGPGYYDLTVVVEEV